MAGLDPEADLERGGMAPGAPARWRTVTERGAPTDDGWRFSLWTVALIVALASVAVAGLLTGARRAHAADRLLDAAQERHNELILQLQTVIEERDTAREDLRAALRQLEDG